jgi:hypothetical protein
MKTNRIIEGIGIIICVVVLFTFNAGAGHERYYFDGSQLYKVYEEHGNTKKTVYCKDQINLKELKISEYTTQDNSGDIYVSPNEKYFIFHGATGRQSEWMFFLVDIRNCKIIRELTVGNKYHIISYCAAFSPDSKILYVSWHLSDVKKNNEDLWLSSEYSGKDFKEEKMLKNIVIPSRVIFKNNYIYGYKFSKDGRYLVMRGSPTIVEVKEAESGAGTRYLGFTVWNVQKDKEIYVMEKWEDYFRGKRFYFWESVPDISGNLLLFNFDMQEGTEIDIFDYIHNKMINKVEIQFKGTGMFSSNGKQIIFSSLVDQKTWKKNIIIYDINTGKQLGKTALDEADEIVDFSDKDRQVIYKREGIKKKIGFK